MSHKRIQGAPELRQRGFLRQSGLLWALPVSKQEGQTSRQAAYEASKGAIRLFTKGAATEYAAHGIRVNSLHPGVINTPMAEHLLQDNDIKTAVLGPTLLGRAGTAEEIAGAALYLASDESSFVVGTEMIVDGGYTCN